MNKGLEALERIKQDMVYQLQLKGECVVNDNFYTVEKELKALEIIKKRECLFKGLSETTQEEYDLLKEVLL